MNPTTGTDGRLSISQAPTGSLSALDRSGDVLPGVLATGALLVRLYEKVARAQANGVGFSFILVELDHADAIEVHQGRAELLRLLNELREICARSLTSVDDIGQYGPRQLALLLPSVGVERAARLARRILMEARHKVQWGSRQAASLSIACASLGEPGVRSPGALRLLAHQRLVNAVRNGGDRVAAAGPQDSGADDD